MSNPLVTVLTPCYNAGACLRPSVMSILNQTYKHLEIIIIDDGSSDNCLDTIGDLRDPRLRVIRQENMGRASAMNHGLDESAGEFYVAHDADDISYPERIQRQLEAMCERPEVVAVFIGHDLMIKGRIVAPRLRFKEVDECRGDIDRFRVPGIPATAMYRMSAVGDMRFEARLPVAEDVDYVLRIGEKHPMIRIRECLYTYRIHSGSSTRVDPLRNYQMEREVIVRACERRGWDPSAHLTPRPRRFSRIAHRHRERGVVPHFIESTLDLRREGRRLDAVQTAFACIALHPFDPYYYRPLVYCALPLRLLACYRAAKGHRQ